jgi:hypothetical protein
MTWNVRLHGVETGSAEMSEEMNRFIESRSSARTARTSASRPRL